MVFFFVLKVIYGSAFGNLTEPIGVSSLKCDGDEKRINDCPIVHSFDCPSKTYASVFCSNENIVDNGKNFFTLYLLLKELCGI